MKLFGRTGGHYLFWTGAIYFAVGMYCVFVNNFVPVWLAQIMWISFMILPFAIPPFGRWLNMSIDWDKNMFDWIKGKDAYSKEEKDNVYNLPVPKIVPPMPAVPEPEKPAKVFYRMGVTDNNRVAFSMGMSEITMTKLGVQNMIDQLEVFKGQLYDEEDTDE